jgi:hypothetical protein
MKKIVSISAAALALAFAGNTFADEYVAAFTCKMGEDKEVEDVIAANSAWLKWVRENANESITSHVGTAVVGDFDMFLFVDTYPDLATWAATTTALENAPDEIQEGLEGVAECKKNRLWRMRPTP